MTEYHQKKSKPIPDSWKVVPRGSRFIIIDQDTGEIMDDAQGYGYKSKDGAYRAAYFKQNQHKIMHQQRVCNYFLEKHPEFNWRLTDLMFEAAKYNGSVQPSMVDELAAELNIPLPYSSADFLKTITSKTKVKR